MRAGNGQLSIRWRSWPALVFISAIGLINAPGFAQEAEGPDVHTDDVPSVESIIQKYIDARGGEMPLFGISSLRLKGHIDSLEGMAQWTEIEFHWKEGNWASRFTGGSRDVFRGKYGNSYWLSDGSEPPRWVTREDSMPLKEVNRGPRLSQAWLDFDGEIRVAGREMIDEHDCWQLVFVPRDGITVERWFDVETGLARQTKYESNGDVMITRSNEYREFDGVLFPVRSTTTYPRTGLVVQVVIDELEFNESFPASRIVPPASLLD